MVYLDTNILIYASVEQDIAKKEKSLELLEILIAKDKLVLSTLVLQEFVFTVSKLKIENEIIQKDSDFYLDYVSVEQDILTLKKAIELCCDKNYCKNINDIMHLLLAEKSKCSRLITFDKDFKKLEHYCDIEIEVL